MNTRGRKTNESYKFVLNLSQKVDLKVSNKHVALQNLSIYYISKKKHENNKLKIMPPTLKNDFELSDGYYYVSDIQDYVEYVIKKL